ncbi:hypothetical protein [Methylobacterium sp. J-076]|uniref:hypothetical protein n=1 Tax=Methylobacterium sp. J-076 TaxID=2836655 RepID=UPI001FB8714B|nr:hypothetical protein [Methylobacterium sp. J-076]
MDMPVPALICTPVSSLEKIAEALGIQSSAFSDAAMAAKIGTFAELLRLWEEMPSEPARNRILAAARREAAHYGRSNGITPPGTLVSNTTTRITSETLIAMPAPNGSKMLIPTLESIANALGLPVRMLSDPTVTRMLDLNAELNRLWEALDCEASRQALLSVARVLIAAQSV